MKRSPSVLSLCVGLAAACVGLFSPAAARAGGISPDLERRFQASPNSEKKVRVIVRYAGAGVDGRSLAWAHGGQLLARHAIINGGTLSVPVKALERLRH